MDNNNLWNVLASIYLEWTQLIIYYMTWVGSMIWFVNIYFLTHIICYQPLPSAIGPKSHKISFMKSMKLQVMWCMFAFKKTLNEAVTSHRSIELLRDQMTCSVKVCDVITFFWRGTYIKISSDLGSTLQSDMESLPKLCHMVFWVHLC